MTTDTALEILLVEDNPGDARYIREILRDATELSERTHRARSSTLAEQTVQTGGKPNLRQESRLSTGLAALDEQRPDIVLLDLGLPDSTGLETLEAVLADAESVPVVVLTGLSDREVGLEALRQGADEYLVKDEINADLLIRSIYHAIERNAHERHLEAQRERLEALNQLNGVVQEIIDAVIEQSTRAEIEQTVCEQLAAASSYAFAWIGEVDSASETIVRRTEAGADGYLDNVTISVDPDDPRSQGPAGKAARTGELQVVSDVYEDPQFEPWRDAVEEYGYRSVAVIPIQHEGTLYGLLSVYANRSNAFAGEEREVIGQLGEIVGHAIAAVERKRTLMSDEVIEVDILVPDVLTDTAATGLSGQVTLDRAVPVGDEYRVYGTADGEDLSVVETLVDSLDHWDAVEVVAEDDDRVTFELHLIGPSILTMVASHGGDVTTAVIEDGDYRVTAQLPHNATIRRVIETIQEVYPAAVVQAQRLVTRSDDGPGRVRAAFEELLTDRQRTVLETAYSSGYFEWPRERSGKEVAESLDLSPPTFSEHLRGAENRIFGSLFGDEDDE